MAQYQERRLRVLTDVDITKGGKRLAESFHSLSLGSFSFLLGMEPQVFEKDDLAYKKNYAKLLRNPKCEPSLKCLPPLACRQCSSTSFPTQSSKKVTGFPSCFSTSGITGFKEYFSTFFPSGRPRWDIKMTALAPLSRAYLMVGTAPTIRWVLVTLRSALRGTLKST